MAHHSEIFIRAINDLRKCNFLFNFRVNGNVVGSTFALNVVEMIVKQLECFTPF